MKTRVPAAALAVIALLALVGCVPEPAPAGTTTAPVITPTPSPTATPDPLAGMTLEQRVAQLFMVGTPADGADPTALSAVSANAVGGIFLRGRSDAGVAATAAVVAQFTTALPAGSAPLWVATDQEGGDVQVLSGPGFDPMPTALTQAKAGPAALQSQATGWGAQLAQAGVTMNLAPVADIVSGPDAAASNPPIGKLNREYGFDEPSVVAGAGAFAAGMRAAGILPTFKHFPGLGRTTANTDYSAGVVDTEVTAASPDVDAYRGLLPQGPAVVMVSTAVYDGIDPAAPAVFSPAVVTDLLRGRLGFDGVVMTDDLSATAQVAAWSPADRAVLSVRAGVDLLLISADATVFPEMYDAVLQTARSDPAFAAQVDAAARRIVELKQQFP